MSELYQTVAGNLILKIQRYAMIKASGCLGSTSTDVTLKILTNTRPIGLHFRDVAIYSWLVRQKLSAEGAIASAVGVKPS